MSGKAGLRSEDYWAGYDAGYQKGSRKDRSAKATTECINRIRAILRASGDNSVTRYLISHELNKMTESL